MFISIDSDASGNKCKKAPPINAPADKETKNKVIFGRTSFFKIKKNATIQTHKVIENVANKICSKIILFFKLDIFYLACPQAWQ